jgi:hypothetical protein
LFKKKKLIFLVTGIVLIAILKISLNSPYSKASESVSEERIPTNPRFIRTNGEIDLSALSSAIKNQDNYDLISDFIYNNFNKIPEKIRNELILNLFNTEEYYPYSLFQLLILNFDKLPDNLKEKLYEMTEEFYAPNNISSVLKYNYQKIPSELKNKLLSLILKNKDIKESREFIELVLENYQTIPQTVKNKILNDEINHNLIIGYVYSLIDNYEKLPVNDREKILNKLLPHQETVDKSQSPVFPDFFLRNYKLLPDKVKKTFDESLDNFIKQKDSAYKFAMYFKFLPKDYREALFFKFNEDKNNYYSLFTIIIENYQTLPKNITALISEYQDKVNSFGIIFTIPENYDKLPQQITKLLEKVAEKEPNNPDLIRAIMINYNKLPEKITNLLFNLDNEKITEIICENLKTYFEDIPKDRGLELINLLTKKQPLPENLPQVLLANYKTLPSSVSNKVFEYTNDKKLSKSVAEGILENYEELPKNIQGLLLNIIDSFGISNNILNSFIENFEKIPFEPRDGFLSKVPEAKVELELIHDLLGQHGGDIPREIKNKLFKKLNYN